MFADVARYRSFLLDTRPGGQSGAPIVLGRKKTYKVTGRARGKRIGCLVEGSNRGGPALAAPPDSVAVPR